MKNETLTAILNEKDKLSAYMGVGVDYYKGETGKSGADEVYIGAEPPTDPQVKLWVDTEAQSVGAVDWDDVGNKPNFATVAESGSYNDLTDKPVIPEAPDLTPYAKTADLSTVATSGSYEDLIDKPTIPEAPDLSNYATKDDLANAKPDLTPYAKTADLSTVATSGSYNDLTNKPNLFSGNYEDLTNKPTIPEPYTLPTASTDTLGGVKVDGSTITIADGVISSAGGGGTDLSNGFVTGDTNITDGLTRTVILGTNNNNISHNVSNSIILGDSNISNSNYTAKYTNTIICGESNKGLMAGRVTNALILGTNNWGGTGYGSSGQASFVVSVGEENYFNGDYASHLYGFGQYINILPNNFVIGKANIADEKGQYRFIIGKGTSQYTSERANALTVDLTGNLAIAGTMSSAGADYAEFFEWKDGNPEAEDRVGYIVSLDGDKLTLANEGDYILGVVSGTATVLGDNPEWNWAKRWVTDDFGRIQYEDKVIHHEAEERNGETIPAWDETIKAPVVNPDYNPDQKYTKRADRPEWSAVGMMGKLYVRDDGTCQVNGFAKPINGVATASTSGTMRVIERVSDNVIRVVIK